MESKNLNEFIDHQRWLISIGVIPAAVKDSLFLYGSIVNEGVTAVEVDINVATRNIFYRLFLNKQAAAAYFKYLKLQDKKDLFSLWRKRRLLKKYGNLNLKGLLERCVGDLCGPKWSVSLSVFNDTEYSDDQETSKFTTKKDRA
jgi:hypothetical protein